MAFTQNVNPTLPKQPRSWQCALSLSDAQNWKLCCPAGQSGAAANGDKLVSALVTSNDSGAKVIQMAFGRQNTCTATNATPAVFTQSGPIVPLAVGDQVILGGTPPTGFAINTTYFVSVTNLNNVTGTFSLSTTAANAAAGTNIASSSTGSAVNFTVMRIQGSMSVAANAGTDGSAVAQNFFNNTLVPFPVDQDGNSYSFLESGDFLYFSSTTNITSAKSIHITATPADF